MNGIKNSVIKVFLFIGFQVLMSSLICFTQAVDSIDQEDLQNDKVMRTPMPGKIMRVNVQKGQEVKAGDLLYIIEAMKMEMTVHSPLAGQIQDVLYRANDIVDGNCAIINFTPPFVERNDMNQVPKGENKDISPITLASYVTDAPPPGSSHTGNLPGLIPSGTLSTESSSHGPFLINPLATDPIQKETIRRASYAWKLNYVFNVPTDDIDSNSSPIHSPDENDARGALVDNRDLLIALFSYASSLPPSGSFPPKPFPPESFPVRIAFERIPS